MDLNKIIEETLSSTSTEPKLVSKDQNGSLNDLILGTINELPQSPFTEGTSPNAQEDFDFRIQKNLDPVTKRAELQPWTEQAFNSIAGGTISGLATAVEDISYLPNIATQFFGNDYESNALAETMQSFKESLGETLPIYRSGKGTWSWDDGAIVWDSLKGILDSAVGFGLPGIGIAGTVSKGVSRASKLFKILEGSKAMQAAITSVGSGLIMNDLEGTMMGVELYDNLVSQGVDKEVAAQKANEFKRLNRLFAITDALQVHGLFKGELPGGTRNMLNPRGIIANLGNLSEDNLLLQGLKEGVEEIGQNVIQSEKEYEGLKAVGKDELAGQISDKKDLFSRILDLATSDKALYEGMLGFLGGGPQRIMSDAIAGNYGKQGKLYDQQYQQQQDLIKTTKDTLDKTLSDFQRTSNLLNEASSQGEDGLVQAVKDSEFTKLMIKNFNAGTTQSLQNQLEEIANLNPDIAQERGLGENYKSEALNALNELKKSEKQWNKLTSYVNKEEIFFNIKKGEILNKQYTFSKAKQAEAETALNNAGTRIAAREISKAIDSKGLSQDLSLGITYDINNLDNNPYENPVQKKAYNQTVNYLKKTREYKNYQKAKEEVNTIEQKLEDNDKQYDEITSEEYQKTGYQKKLAKVFDEASNEMYEGLNSSLNDVTSEFTSKNEFDDLKSQLQTMPLSDENKQKLSDKIDKIYEDRLKAEYQAAPSATEDVSSLDKRYENRPVLLQHELQIASEKEGVEFKTLDDYKAHLEKTNKKATDIVLTPVELKPGVVEVKNTDNTKQPSTVSPEVDDSNINAMVNDMVFFKFKKIAFTDKVIDTHSTKITILNKTNAETSMSLADFSKKYSITEPIENWNESTHYTLKDLDNNPIPSDLNDTNVDLDYLRDGKLKDGDELFLEVDRDYNQKNISKIGSADKFKVLLVKYDSGQRIIVGVLPASKTNASLKTLREDIWEGYNNSTSKIYQFPTKTKVKSLYSGKFWNTGTFNNPKKVLKSGQPYIIAVAAKNAINTVELISGYTNEMGTKEIELPNGEKIFIVKDKNDSAKNLTEGAIYQILQAPDGKYYAYRTFTKKVKEMSPKFKQEILTILNDIYEGKRDYASAKKELEDWYVSNEFTYTTGKGFNWKNPATDKNERELTAQELYDKANFDNSFVSVKAYSGGANKGTPMMGAKVTKPDGKVVSYNDYLADEGIIYTDLNPIQNFHSVKFSIEDYQRKTEPKAPAKTISKKASEDDIDINMMNDADDVNIHQLAGLFLPQQQPNITTTSVENIKPLPKISDTEAKKADIERRRQEEFVNSFKEQQEYIDNFTKLKEYGDNLREAYNNLFDKQKNQVVDSEEVKLFNYINDKINPDAVKNNSDIEELVQDYIDFGIEQLEKGKKSKNPNSRAYKINAKYDAELAALEQQFENKIPEDLGKPKKDIKGKFKFRLELENQLKKWDRLKEESWFKTRFPNVPIHVLDDLKKIHKQDINAQGLFYNAAVYIKDNAGEGTTYHESFHVAFSMYLTDSEQQSILKEAREKLGFAGTDLEIEEKLADRFMEQVLANEEIKSLPARIKRFFNNLWKFIKFYVFNAQDIDTLFYSIEENKFFDVPRFKRDVSKLAPKFSNPYGKELSPFESYQTTKMIRDLVYSILKDERATYPNASNKEFYGLMFDRTNRNNAVLEAYRQLRSVVYTQEGKINPEYQNKPEIVAKINAVLTRIYNDGKFGTGYDEVVRSFSTIGINIVDKYDTIEEDEENAEEGGVKGDRYVNSYAQENPMDRVSDKMKMWLNSIPNITQWKDNDDYDTTTNLFGYPETLPEDYARTYLLDNFSNSLNVVDMVNKITKSADKNPWLNKVLADIQADADLKTDLFLYLQNIKANFVFVKSKSRIELDGSSSTSFIVSNSNSTGVIKTILNDWNTGFNSNINRVLHDGKINTTAASVNYQKLLEINKKLDNSQETLNTLSTILEDTGLTIPGAALDNLSRDNKSYKTFVNQFTQLYKLISEGENPFTNIYEEDVNDITKAKGELGSANLRKMAEQIKKTYPSYYQPTHVNTEGNKVFNHIRASFMGKMITKLTNSNVNLRNEFIDSYLNTVFYKDSPFLNALRDNIDGVTDKLSFNIFDGLEREGQDEGLPYSKLSEAQLNIALLNLWHNGGNNTSYYGYPVLSDTGNMVLLTWKKYNKAQALDGLYKTALQEWSRINAENKPKLKNFTKNSNKFILFPYLNDHKNLFKAGNELKIKALIEQHFEENLVKDYFEKLVKWGVVKESNGQYLTKDKQLDSGFGNLKEKITDFVYADTLMQMQTAITFSGDVAFFKSTEDFYKRNKQVWSPGTYLDVSRLDGNTSYKVKVVKDIEGASRFANDIENALIRAGFNKQLAKEKSDLFREGVNETDAQAYIDIYSYRQRLKGLARWTDREEDSYKRIIKGEGTNGDFNVILQTLKPFVFTHTLDIKSKLISPLQLKNSEMLLIPQFAEKSPKLRVLMQDFGYNFDNKGKYTGFDLKSRNVDEVMFESAVKVGLQEELQTWDKISESTPYLVDYSDYRLQQETPVHHLDDENLLGSQIKKLIIGDLDLTATYVTPSGKKFTGSELINEYNLILNKEIEDKYGKLSEKLSPSNLTNVVNAIKQEVRDRGLSKQFLDALEPRADGSTVLPLWHPLIFYKVETMLNSIVKNNGTKLKFNGGSFYNAAAFGFDDKLDLVFNEDGSINYFEVMMPAWSKDFIKYFTDKNGDLDLKKLEEAGIDTGIVYRIPTENKYSMFRIKIKGFTPDIAGGAILMPSLVTKIAGLDFDIDKVYAMLYNHRIENNKVVKVESGLDSQEARQNYLLDLMSAVLTNKASLSQQLTPGGFSTLEELANKFKKFTTSKKDTGYFSPNTRTEVFTNMMTGSNNIGIFANMNATHQLYQNAKEFLGFTKPIKFDGKSLKDLRTFDDVTNNRKVTDNIAEFLAAAVDNGKNPLAAYLNINTYTADVIGSIIAVGYPIETALSFVNQPVIRKLTDMYFLEKGRMSEVNMFNTLQSELQAQINTILGNNEAVGEWILSTDEMMKYVEYNGNTENRTKRFYLFQNEVLSAFKQLKEQGGAYSKLIAATKVSDSGPGPTFAETTAKLRSISKTRGEEFANTLIGADKFFDEDTPNNKLTKKFIIDATNNFFNNSNITYVFNNGIQELIGYFEDVKQEDLTAKEIEGIQRNIISFLATGFEAYNPKDNKSIVRSVPKRLLEYKAKSKGKSAYEPFLSYLKVNANKDKTTQSEIPFIIEFDGNTGSNQFVQDNIVDTWDEMLKNGSNEEKQLAKDLVRYTFYSAGFNFAPTSFYHIVPVSFFRNLTDSKGNTFDAYLKQKIDESKYRINNGNAYLINFKEQYIRNYFQKLSFVKKAIYEDANRKNVTSVIYSDYKNNRPTPSAQPTKIIINLDSKTDLLKKSGDDVTPRQYIKHKYGANNYLFKFDRFEEGNAIYTRLEHLGLKIKDVGSLEFDINNGALESAWKFNKLNKSSDSSLEIKNNSLPLQDEPSININSVTDDNDVDINMLDDKDFDTENHKGFGDFC